jgi:superfamily II DNA or RNA helicase
MIVRVSGLVWLPKSDLNNNQIINIKRSLTVIPKRTTDIVAKEDPKPIFMFEETDTELGVPREWYLKNVTKEHEEKLEISYGSPMWPLKTLWKAEGPYKEQEDTMRVFENKAEGRKWCGFTLRASCGYGKTQCALEFARRLGRSTLILVHKEFFLEQWTNAILGVMPDARIGIIRQNKCDYKEKDFVIGMIQSLSREGGEKYPVEIYSNFGTILIDEMHRMAAPTFADVIYRFNAAFRVGVSATPKRKDGAQDVFFNHISNITYNAKTEAQIPGLRILKTDTRLKDIVRGSYRVETAYLNSAQIINQLCSDAVRTRDIVDQVVQAVKVGRKIMVVSERLGHLKEMADLVSQSIFNMNLPFSARVDYYTGDWFTGEVWDGSTKSHKRGEPKLRRRTSEELEHAESANVIFATKQCTEEGLDIASIDVIVLSTPMGDPEQTVGRVRRWCVAYPEKCKKKCPWRAGTCLEKPKPIVLDVVDENIQRLVSKWKKRQRFYREIGMINK